MAANLTVVGRLFRLATVLFAIGTVELRSAPLDQWYWRNPLPQGNWLHNVVFANGGFIALGEVGTILSSTDGTNWVRQASGVTTDLRDCAYGNGRYVIVGDFGTILTSTNGIVWSQQYGGTFYSLNGVCYGGGQFVAVGEQTIILTSTDGATWTPPSSGPWELYDVIHAGGLFVAAGGSDSTTGSTCVILTSTDGVVWTPRLLNNGGPFVSLACGEGTFAALSRYGGYSAYGGYLTPSALWLSDTGLNWQQNNWLAQSFHNAANIAYGGGRWVLTVGNVYDPAFGFGGGFGGTGEMLASDDLLNWVQVVSNSSPVTGVAFGNGKFVSSQEEGSFLCSSDGLNWTNPWPQAAIGPVLRDLKYLNGQFWDVAYNQLASSLDGVVWTNTIAVTNTSSLHSITFGKGLYVAGSQYRTIWISADGANWTNPAPNLSVQPYVADVAVAFGNGVFVGAAGYSADILTSSDGTNWLVQQLQTNAAQYVYFGDVTFADDRFVAVSDNAIATSSDGTNWSFMSGSFGVRSVAGGNGKFVTVGRNVIMVSSDGTNWISQRSSALGFLTDVAFGNGYFVATEGRESGVALRTETGTWVSKDGMHWSRRPSGTSRALSQIAFGNGTFVLGAEDSAILQSDPMVVLEPRQAAPSQLLLYGPVNRIYRIDFRDGLKLAQGWNPLATLVVTNSPAQFFDASWTNSPQRFYRAVLLP